jgi:catalase
MKAAMTDLTTASGIPVADNQNSITAGPRGPVLLPIA